MHRLTLVIAYLAATLFALSGTVRGEDESFINAATDPSFHRDAHGMFIGSTRLGSAGTSDGQNTGITFSQIGAASNIWNDEHNQLLFGAQYSSRTFDRQLNLPGGIVLPERIDRASGSLVYKHITDGDVSLVQSIQLARTGGDGLSGPTTNNVDLIGLASVMSEPGYVWLYGYMWSYTGNGKISLPIPLIVYFSATSEVFSWYAGFPVFGLNYSPHPDLSLALNWGLGGGPSAAAFYKVSGRNYARLTIGDETWSYRVPGPGERVVTYYAERIAIGWSYLPYFERRRSVGVNVFLGWDLDRQIGSNNMLKMGKAPFSGFTIGFGF